MWAVFNGAFFSSYEQSKLLFARMLAARRGNGSSAGEGKGDPLPTYAFPLCAGASGAVAAAVSAPLDLIKTRLQTQGNSKLCARSLTCCTFSLPHTISDCRSSCGRYSGSLDCVRKIVAGEGPFALFGGLGARVIWLVGSVWHAAAIQSCDCACSLLFAGAERCGVVHGVRDGEIVGGFGLRQGRAVIRSQIGWFQLRFPNAALLTFNTFPNLHTRQLPATPRHTLSMLPLRCRHALSHANAAIRRRRSRGRSAPP